jgi:uncharacterized membrane protein
VNAAAAAIIDPDRYRAWLNQGDEVMMSVALLLHVVSAVIWVGGMFFAYMVLRPVAAIQLEAPQRLALWAGVFDKFFPWVFLSIGVILATGLWMLIDAFGGFWSASIDLRLMLGIGIVMMLIFFHSYFAPFQRLKRAVGAEDWTAGLNYLAQIRMLVGANLTLGLLTVAIATGGRYWQG